MTFTGYHEQYRKSYPAIETEGAKLQREQESQYQFRKSYSMKLAMKQEDEGDWWKIIFLLPWQPPSFVYLLCFNHDCDFFLQMICHMSQLFVLFLDIYFVLYLRILLEVFFLHTLFINFLITLNTKHESKSVKITIYM